jgi:IS1 family transposase
MNVLPLSKQAAILSSVTEGAGLRGASRIHDVAYATVAQLTYRIGHACETFHDRVVRNLRTKKTQADEIWAPIFCKAGRLEKCIAAPPFAGDSYTHIAIDADTRLVIAWRVGPRDLSTAYHFLADLRSRCPNRIQLTTDGHHPYKEAVRLAFGRSIDFSMIVKQYDTRGHVTGVNIVDIVGLPDPQHRSTSYIERFNLTLRTHLRRFSRKDNGISKDIEHHRLGLALLFVYYNFVRYNKARPLRCTPAMAAGLTDHIWTMEELASLPNVPDEPGTVVPPRDQITD